jgi:putative ABC transport system ATP-binding protein
MIKIINLKIEYNKKIIVDNFNLNIKNGEKVILKGVSGSGKSSILKAILGFILPESGDIFIDEVRVTGKSITKLREKFSYISQGVDLRNEKVSFLIDEIFNFKQNKQNKKNLENLDVLFEFFQLPISIKDKNLEELSGGEKQRVGIVIAILLDREIYILDEITSALDLELKKKTVDYFLKSEKTVIIVSHDREWSESQKAREVNI